MRLLAALLGAGALVGCGTAPAPSTSVETATIHFGHLPKGTVTVGTTGVSPAAHYDLTGLQPDSVHGAWVDATPCGRAVVPPTSGALDLHADAGGRVTGDLPLAPDPGGVYFHLAVLPGGSPSAVGAELACGRVSAQAASTVAVVAPYERAQGEARLRYDRATRVLEVTVVVDGLAPGSHHPNHIHTGQCELEGPVRDVLTPIDADAHGHASVTTLIPESDGIRRGVWYIAVHHGPQLGTQDQYAVLACGNVP